MDVLLEVISLISVVELSSSSEEVVSSVSSSPPSPALTVAVVDVSSSVAAFSARLFSIICNPVVNTWVLLLVSCEEIPIEGRKPGMYESASMPSFKTPHDFSRVLVPLIVETSARAPKTHKKVLRDLKGAMVGSF